MPIKAKTKIERELVDPKPASPEEIAAAEEQAKVNAEEVPVVEAPVKAEPKAAPVTKEVIFKSLDGRNLQVGVGNFFVEGRTISVPGSYAEEVERLLTDGGYLVTRIN